MVEMRRSVGDMPVIRRHAHATAEPRARSDAWYVCVAEAGANVRSGVELSSSVLRQICLGEAVYGRTTRLSSDGSVRLQLEDGNWTSIRAADGSTLLREATKIDARFVCVCDWGANVRSGIELNTEQVRMLPSGSIVRGVLMCRSSDGSLRLKLDDGTWTSIVAAEGSIFLREGVGVDTWYVCVSEEGANVRSGIELMTTHLRCISCGEAVYGTITCYSSDGSLRLKLEDDAWTSICAADGSILLREAKWINAWFVCVSTTGIPVYSGVEETSTKIDTLSYGEVARGTQTCCGADGNARVRLVYGGWVAMNAADGTAILREATKIDEWFVCTSEPGANVRCGIELSSEFVRIVELGEVVHATLTCRSSDGSLRCKLDDSNWTSIYAADGRTFMCECHRINKWFACVSDTGANVRTGVELSSPQLRSIEAGEAVRGCLTCRSSDGSLRIQLEDGNWTSICAAGGSELLREATRIDIWYVCTSEDGVNVRSGVELTTPYVGRIACGEMVRCTLMCQGSDGSVRLKLEDGNWTSICSAAGHRFLHARTESYVRASGGNAQNTSERADRLLCPVCLDKEKNIAFSCGHQTCLDCSKSLTVCPTCRSTITTKLRLYI